MTTAEPLTWSERLLSHSLAANADGTLAPQRFPKTDRHRAKLTTINSVREKEAAEGAEAWKAGAGAAAGEAKGGEKKEAGKEAPKAEKKDAKK